MGTQRPWQKCRKGVERLPFVQTKHNSILSSTAGFHIQNPFFDVYAPETSAKLAMNNLVMTFLPTL
jgi:hypothetical protein